MWSLQCIGNVPCTRRRSKLAESNQITHDRMTRIARRVSLDVSPRTTITGPESIVICARSGTLRCAPLASHRWRGLTEAGCAALSSSARVVILSCCALDPVLSLPSAMIFPFARLLDVSLYHSSLITHISLPIPHPSSMLPRAPRTMTRWPMMELLFLAQTGIARLQGICR